jgi:hypothetical protein
MIQPSPPGGKQGDCWGIGHLRGALTPGQSAQVLVPSALSRLNALFYGKCLDTLTKPKVFRPDISLIIDSDLTEHYAL